MITRDELLKYKPLIIAGPCSVTSRLQILEIAKEVKKAGAHALRAQLWKPRTKPDSFQGVGNVGISWIKEVKDKVGIHIVMEMVSPQNARDVGDIPDVLWVGARNMQNFELLKEISKDKRPVILKRGLISTVKEWLGAAKYLGEEKVILCERGIRTGADSMRFTLDLNTALVAKHDYNMPILIDPSHTAGRRDMVPHLALSGIAMGADGIVIEVHTKPEEEPVDRDQTITIEVFEKLMNKINKIHPIIHT
jgi:3-deoxy-7-phosphoheptulonate synthase